MNKENTTATLAYYLIGLICMRLTLLFMYKSIPLFCFTLIMITIDILVLFKWKKANISLNKSEVYAKLDSSKLD